MAAEKKLAEQLRELLAGVHPDWHPFFEENGLMDKARAALTKAQPDAAELAPAKNLIFEFLRYFGPGGTRVIIVGQDPYPKDAQGVCFSIPHGAPLKGSLRPVIANLEQHGLARLHYRVQDDAASGRSFSGDLRSWAAQGVLLMNAALTNRIGARGAHRGFWKDFTKSLIRALSSAAEHPLIFMLWGGDARALAEDVIGENHNVYQWTHPSPQSNNQLPPISRFENAPHFADANQALISSSLRPIQWDPLEMTYAFTDGSCINNGKPDAEASFAAFILTGPLKKVEVAGRVEPHEYELVDPDDLLQGFRPVAGSGAAPTNNRGEYLAWCWVLLLLLRGGVRGRAEIISDCNLFIQTMKTWLPARRARGTAEELKNYDLVVIADALLVALREAIACGENGVQLTHVNSHQKKPSAEEGPRAQVLWYGNDRVDRAAGDLLRSEKTFSLTTNSQALDWRLHKRFE